MNREDFRALLEVVRQLGQRRDDARQRYTQATVFTVLAWAVFNNRPVYWACVPENWPPGLRRGPLLSQSQMSRRLRTEQFRRFVFRVQLSVRRRGGGTSLVMAIDGKPLPIASHSTDRQAGYGRAVGGKAKGYKLHAIINVRGVVLTWRVAAMNADERTMARRMIKDVDGPGYLLGDANYDSNKLYARACERQVQCVIPRRYGPGRKVGHRSQHPARLRSRDMLETEPKQFGNALLNMRLCVERFFSELTSTGGGLLCLPAWVRTHRRVQQWVGIKILFQQLHAQRRTAAKAA